MNSGTPASTAPPERSSRGITMSESTRTVFHSAAVKNLGANALPSAVALKAPSTNLRALSSSAVDQKTAAGSAASACTASRRVLVSLRHERTTVSYEKIFHVVSAAIRVDDGLRWIASHSRRTELMDDFSAARDAVALLLVGHGTEDLSAHLFDQ